MFHAACQGRPIGLPGEHPKGDLESECSGGHQEEPHRESRRRHGRDGNNAIDVQLSGRNPSLDPDGSADYGSIDTFRTVADGFWEMEGDWGSVKVNQPVVRLQLD